MEFETYTSARIEKGRSGGWSGVLSYKDEGGTWRKKRKKLSATGKKAAEKELNEWREQMELEALGAEGEAEGSAESEPAETVTEYITKYIEGKARIEASTRSRYYGLLRQQITPYIGSIPLDELSPDTVQAWVNDLSREFQAETVRKAFILFKSAMTVAVERDRLAKNPARTVEMPKAPRKNPNALPERGRAQLVAFLDIADPTPANIGVRLALYLGMREGEICALRWKDVDLATNSLEVNRALGYKGSTYYEKDPKTDGSARTIYYPDSVAEALRKRRIAMQEQCLELGKPSKGAGFDELYVIGDVDGSFMHPHTLYRRWRAVADALELVGTEGRPVTFHDLRHTYATTAIQGGVDVKTVSSILGHANAAMTLNVYASADPDAKRRAAEVMAVALAKPATTAEILEFDPTGTEG